MIHRNYLPDSIVLPTGETLKPVIGGYLDLKPFLTVEGAGVDVTKSGWGINLHPIQEEKEIIAEARRQRLKYRKVAILSRGLRGKLDLYGSPYRSTIWVFVQVKESLSHG